MEDPNRACEVFSQERCFGMLKRITVFSNVLIIASPLFLGVAFSQKFSKASPVTGLVPDHATISVENLDVEAEWYERVLGFKVWRKMDSDPDHINQQMSIPGYRIDLVKHKGSKRPANTDPLFLQQGWIHVVFHVKSVPNALGRLQALHVEPESIRKDDHGNPIAILLRDPENNEIEVRIKERW